MNPERIVSMGDTARPPGLEPRGSSSLKNTQHWLAGILQAMLRLPTLCKNMRPSFQLPNPSAIDTSFLRENGIEGLIWDVDGTLTHYHDTQVPPRLREAFGVLLGTPGLRHVVLSNCAEWRFRELGRVFPQIPILRMYTTRAGAFIYRELVDQRDRWDPPAQKENRIAARHVRKPHADLVEYAVRFLDLPKSRVVMVGDQYLTDIAGANLAGIRSIKIPTMGREGFPVAPRTLQRLETLLYHVMRVALPSPEHAGVSTVA